jgi:hypothetical protein
VIFNHGRVNNAMQSRSLLLNHPPVVCQLKFAGLLNARKLIRLKPTNFWLTAMAMSSDSGSLAAIPDRLQKV